MIVMMRFGREQYRKDVLRPEGFSQSVYSLLLATLAISILSLGLPVLTLQVYDRILPNPGTGTLSVLIAGVCVAIVLEAVLRLTRSYVIGRAGATYEHRMACDAMAKVLNADLSKMGGYGIGEHLQRMSAVSKLKDFYNGYALTVKAELALVPLFFGLIVYIGGYLAVVPAVILAAFTAISIWRGYRLQQALKNREVVDDKRFNFLIESLEGVHTLKAFALEKFFERRYEALEEDSTAANYRVTQETSGTFNIGAVFSHLMVASVISAGAWFVLNGMLTTGGLIAILLLSGRMMQPIQKALALWARYQDYSLARGYMEELFSTPQYIRGLDFAAELTPIVPDCHVVLENATFRYASQEKPILENINLELRRGEAVLISGVHGCGKSTLLNVMAGIYPVEDGRVMVDGQRIQGYRSEDLVRHIGYVRSNPLIFRGTIRDNITCFGQTNERQAREVAALLNVDKEVAALPSGFDTFLSGNDTDNITQGLKQRIAIVRVLATRPRIILFDNADRALDKEGYAMIYSLLARIKNKVSMVIVSDDRNLRGLTERHYRLENASLVEVDEQSTEKSNVRPYKELRL